MTAITGPESAGVATAQYVIDTASGWVLVALGVELGASDVNRITLSLLALGYALCDPFTVEPEHVIEGVRYFIEEAKGGMSWAQ